MRWEETDRRKPKEVWLRDRAQGRVLADMQERGLEGGFAVPGREALKALKVRLYTEPQDERSSAALEAEMLTEVERLAAQPKERTLEERVAELERRAERPE